MQTPALTQALSVCFSLKICVLLNADSCFSPTSCHSFSSYPSWRLQPLTQTHPVFQRWKQPVRLFSEHLWQDRKCKFNFQHHLTALGLCRHIHQVQHLCFAALGEVQELQRSEVSSWFQLNGFFLLSVFNHHEPLISAINDNRLWSTNGSDNSFFPN